MVYQDSLHPEGLPKMHFSDEDERLLIAGWCNPEVSFKELFSREALPFYKTGYTPLAKYMMGPMLLLPTMKTADGPTSFVMAITGFIPVKTMESLYDGSSCAVNVYRLDPNYCGKCGVLLWYNDEEQSGYLYLHE